MNKLYLLFRTNVAIVAIAALAFVFQSCKDENIIEHGLDAEQLAAGRIAGTWGSPANIVTPGDVPAAIFGEMRLVFTTTSEGHPDKFIAKGCPIVFSDGAGDWSVSLSEDIATINLSEVIPVDEFKASASASALTISFYMGWENTETGETGEGEFSATLKRL